MPKIHEPLLFAGPTGEPNPDALAFSGSPVRQVEDAADGGERADDVLESC